VLLLITVVWEVVGVDGALSSQVLAQTNGILRTNARATNIFFIFKLMILLPPYAIYDFNNRR
jgi:hypothetical protein